MGFGAFSEALNTAVPIPTNVQQSLYSDLYCAMVVQCLRRDGYTPTLCKGRGGGSHLSHRVRADRRRHAAGTVTRAHHPTFLSMHSPPPDELIFVGSKLNDRSKFLRVGSQRRVRTVEKTSHACSPHVSPWSNARIVYCKTGENLAPSPSREISTCRGFHVLFLTFAAF